MQKYMNGKKILAPGTGLFYLDNCCFNRPYDDQNHQKILLETEAKLNIQQKITIGEIELVWSYILDFENNENPNDMIRNAI